MIYYFYEIKRFGPHYVLILAGIILNFGQNITTDFNNYNYFFMQHINIFIPFSDLDNGFFS